MTKKHRHKFKGNLSTLQLEYCPNCGDSYEELYYCDNGGGCRTYRCRGCKTLFEIRL